MISNLQRFEKLEGKFKTICECTLDDTCFNLFNKEVTLMKTYKNDNPDMVNDKMISRMRAINKTCKAIVQQVFRNDFIC